MFDDDEHTYKSQRRFSFKKTIIILIFVFVGVRLFVGLPYTVPSHSMEPTVLPGDRILTLVSAYGIRNPFDNEYLVEWGKPERGDIVVFRKPDDTSKTYIKRIVGLPGDRIQLKGTILVINGMLRQPKLISTAGFSLFEERLNDRDHFMVYNDIPDPKEIWPKDGSEFLVPEDSYFALGDHRDRSADSREWGVLQLHHILGKASMVVWSYDTDAHGGGVFRWGRMLQSL